MNEIDKEPIYICPDCVGDKTLKRQLINLRPEMPDGPKCTLHPKKKGIPVAELARVVDRVFRANFTFGDLQPDFNPQNDEVEYYQQGLDIDEVLGDLLEAEELVLNAVKQELFEIDDYWPPDGERPFYDDSQYYEQIHHSGTSYNSLWRSFREEIVHQQRFFNDNAIQFLQEIFEEFDRLKTRNAESPLYLAGPSSPLAKVYRVRVANGDVAEEKIVEAPQKELASPPVKFRVSGRMNASGIPAFYGALDFKTCIAEMRPPVGSTLVGAEFEIIRPICVLDLTKFSGPVKTRSLFDKNYIRTMEQWAFMQSFAFEISQPILPTDEHLEYVPTQVVAEYLTKVHKVKVNGKERHVDAIIFSSAQNRAGRNMVIFGDARFVEGEFEEGRTTPKRLGKLATLLAQDTPEASLRVNAREVKTFNVNAATYKTTENSNYSPLSRLKWGLGKNDF